MKPAEDAGTGRFHAGLFDLGWPVFLVINEIEKSKRFALENLIVAGVWSGPSKPSREDMFLLFTDIMEQLKILEQGKLFRLYSSSGKLEEQTLKVYNVSS
jgi:hypothetical protein